MQFYLFIKYFYTYLRRYVFNIFNILTYIYIELLLHIYKICFVMQFLSIIAILLYNSIISY